MFKSSALKKSQLHAGFTVLELVMVITLVGLLSATVVPRFFSVNTFDSRFYFDQFFNALNYSINFESTTDCASQFEFYDASPPIGKTSGYSLYREEELAVDCGSVNPPVFADLMQNLQDGSAWQVSELESRVYQYSDDGSAAVDITSMLIKSDEGVLTVTMNGAVVTGEITINIAESGIVRSFKLDTNTGYLW